MIASRLLPFFAAVVAIRRERVMAGIADARRAGRHLGRPRSAALKANEVRRLFATGVSKAAIARKLGMSRMSVRRFVRADVA
jgi:DNA invertase Pin-like site-specific DNA recombinase